MSFFIGKESPLLTLDYARWITVQSDNSSEEDDSDEDSDEEDQPQYRFRVRTVGVPCASCEVIKRCRS